MSDNAEEKPRIIVDDDWKARVQAEKEEWVRKQQQSKTAVDEDPELPPASFATLVSSLATQALAALGRIPDPIEGRFVTRLKLAKHFIDTLGVLEEKTQGNLTPDEQKMLEDLLHQLRLDYVAGGYKPPPSSDSA